MNKFSFIDLWIMIKETEDEHISKDIEALQGLYLNTFKGKLRNILRQRKWRKI